MDSLSKSSVLYVRMDDPEGAALYEQITNKRKEELKTVKQFVLVCIAEHFAYDDNELAQKIVEYLKSPRVGRPKKASQD